MDLSRAWDSIRKRLESDSLKEFGPPIVQIIGFFILAAYLLDLVWPWYKTNREAVVPLMTGIGGIIALAVAFGQFKTARLRHEEQTRADLQRRMTESFSKAVEQLGSDKLEVRLGGIYAMEQIAKESLSRSWTVIETLTGFVRERARWKEAEMDEDSVFDTDKKSGKNHDRCPTDIQAVMAVIGRRDEESRKREELMCWQIDLREVDLRGVDLNEAHLERAIFSGAHLERAELLFANLESISLRDAHLEDADLDHAHLERANLSGADLRRANLFSAHLEGASLHEAKLEGADLRVAKLEGVHGLNGSQIMLAKGDDATVLPIGVPRPKHWG
jgi:uncharacterized protein YjbI with pentapeptide repeats